MDTALKTNCESWTALLQLSAKEVFSLMLASELTEGSASSEEELDITSMVGLAGSMRGLLTVRCASRSAALMASKMLGIEGSADSPEVLDAVGEVCNMVAGNFKNKITGMGDGCKLSVPTVITGADYNLRALGEETKLELTLLFEGHPLVVSLEISN